MAKNRKQEFIYIYIYIYKQDVDLMDLFRKMLHAHTIYSNFLTLQFSGLFSSGYRETACCPGIIVFFGYPHSPVLPKTVPIKYITPYLL